MNSLSRTASGNQAAFDFELPAADSERSVGKSGYPRLVSVQRIDEGVKGRVDTLNESSAKAFYRHRTQCAGSLVATFEAQFQDFWLKRYRQHTDTARLCKRVASIFGLDLDTVYQIYRYLGLPECQATSEHRLSQNRFSTCLYVNPSDGLEDPLDRFYRKTCYRAAVTNAYQYYLDVYGWLAPDMIDPADIRYVLSTYPMHLSVVAQLLQIRESEFTQYVHAMGWPTSYRCNAPKFRDLVGKSRHDRLSRIVMRCAQAVYTHQAIPMKEIATRLGLAPMVLFTQGEHYVGEWRQPQLHTIQHVIEHTTVLHLQQGGMLRGV